MSSLRYLLGRLTPAEFLAGVLVGLAILCMVHYLYS